MKKIILTIFTAVAFATAGSAQNTIVKDFKPVCDSLDVMLKKNRDVKGSLQLKLRLEEWNAFTEGVSDVLFPKNRGAAHE